MQQTAAAGALQLPREAAIVMRYKSTGDILNIADYQNSGEHEQFLPQRPSVRPSKRATALDSEEDDHDITEEEDEEDEQDEAGQEFARQSTRPLLPMAHNGNTNGYNKWNSCKLIEASNRYSSGSISDQMRGDLFSQPKVKQHSKSTGDFLSALVEVQQQQSVGRQIDYKQKTKKTKDKDEEEKEEVKRNRCNSVAATVSQANSIEQVVSYEWISNDHCFGCWPEQVAETDEITKAATRMKTIAAQFKQQPPPNGAQKRAPKRRQRKSQDSKKQQVKLAATNLSLSSPALARIKQQQQPAKKTNVVGCCTVQANGHRQRPLESDESQVCADGSIMDDDDGCIMRRQQQQQVVVDMCETKASNSTSISTSSTSSSSSSSQRQHCVVDVDVDGELLMLQPHQKHLTNVRESQMAPVEPHTQEQRNKFVSSAATKEGDSEQRLADSSRWPANKQHQGTGKSERNNDDDGQLPTAATVFGGGSGIGIGIGATGATNDDDDDNGFQLLAGLALTGVGVSSSNCGGGGANQFYCSPGQANRLQQQDNNNPLLQLQQQQRPEREQTTFLPGLHYFKQSPSSCHDNNNLVMLDREKPNTTQVEVAPETQTTTQETTSSVTNKLMGDLNSAATRLMDTCCQSWLGQALHPNHFGSYKVSQSEHTTAVVPAVSGSCAIFPGSCAQRRDTTTELLPAAGTTTTTIVRQETGGKTYYNNRSNGNSGTVSTKQERAKASVDQQQRGSKSVSSARYSRPGRSPISLQRSTNARLTRHKLKIQQQRQEQLAQLALRERRQIDQNYHYTRQQQQQQPQTVINSTLFRQTQSLRTAAQLDIQRNSGHQGSFRRIENHYQQQPELTTLNTNSSPPSSPDSLYLINGLLDRLSFSRSTKSGYRTSTRSAQISSSYFQREQELQELIDLRGINRLAFDSNNRLELRPNQQQQQQQQVIIPTATRAIEICDNQLASSSRQAQTSSSSNSQRRSQRSSSGGNVIVYKSINMLKNGSPDILGEGAQDEGIESDSQTICSSGSTMSLNRPFCKICHLGTTKNGDKLISPCRCSGTMQYIHCGCLLKWLEISNRSNEKPISCELCAHEYTWHKKFNYRHMKLPKCSFKDIILHLIFVAAIGVMFFSALAPMIYRRSNDSAIITTVSSTNTAEQATGASFSRTIGNDHHARPFHHHNSFAGQSNHIATATGRLAYGEKFMLLCAASFFISFFLAIYVQTKARDTLYGLFIKFLGMNKTYYITEYDHGQLNNNHNIANNSNTNNTTGCGSSNANSKQQQQYHQQSNNVEDSRVDRKNSQKS